MRCGARTRHELRAIRCSVLRQAERHSVGRRSSGANHTFRAPLARPFRPVGHHEGKGRIIAQYVFNANSWTPTATADTTNLADNTYMAVQGGSATIMHKFIEIYMGGENSASALNIICFGRDTVVEATPTALTTKQSLTPLNPAAIATTAVANVAATTKPQRDVARHLLDLSFNSFGGIVRWVAAPGSEILTIGNAAASATTGGEVSLSGFTGATSGAQSAHILFEQMARTDRVTDESVNPTLQARYNHRARGAKARLARHSDEWRGLTI